MKPRSFPLERNGPTRVEVQGEGATRRVFLDGQLIYSFADLTAFNAGVSLPLPDGSVLRVGGVGPGGLDLRRNGVPLPGLTRSPEWLAVACFPWAAIGWLFTVGWAWRPR